MKNIIIREKKYVTFDQLLEISQFSLSATYRKEILHALHDIQPLGSFDKQWLNDCTNSITKVISLIDIVNNKTEEFPEKLKTYLSDRFSKALLDQTLQTARDYMVYDLLINEKNPQRLHEFSDHKRTKFHDINKYIVDKIRHATTKKQVYQYVSIIYRMMNHHYDTDGKKITWALLEQPKIYA